MTQIDVAVRRISFDDGVGGMERAAQRHILSMCKAGYTVRIFTDVGAMTGHPPSSVSVIDVPWPAGMSTGGGPTFGCAYLLWVRKLRRALRRAGACDAVLHLHGATSAVLSDTSLRKRYVTVVNPHGLEAFGAFSLKRMPNRVFLRHMAKKGRFADAVIATDASLVDHITRNVECSDTVRVIPNAVDCERLRTLASFKNRPRSNDVFVVVSIGRLVRNKGYDLLAQALGDRRIQDAVGKSLRWTHFGDGAALDSVRAYANDHGVDLRIRSGCSDEEVQSELSGADLFVQPSRYEGSSLTTLEAMVHGRRIVATPVGGIVDKVIDGVTGHLAAEVTVESIAEAILRALGDEENSCGRGAMEAVNGRFSSEAESLLYQHLYKSLAEARLLKRSVS